MLSKRRNFLETVQGGTPDRFVKQHEAFANCIGRDPLTKCYPLICNPGEQFVDAWGVTNVWVKGTPGVFPLHDEKHKVIKDITRWREVVKAPNIDFDESVWEEFIAFTETVDREESLLTLSYLPGIFEEVHYLMGMEDMFVALYDEPEEMKALINYITEFELKYLEMIFDRAQFDVFFQDDDLGSQVSTFLSPDMMREFFFESYQRIYGYVKSRGVKTIVHHSDSYAATLVPFMIEVGIDVWQGPMKNNDIPKLIQESEGKLVFMGGLNNGIIDVEDWTKEAVAAEVTEVCKACGTAHFIPCLIQAGPFSTYEGVYDAVNETIDAMSEKMFGIPSE